MQKITTLRLQNTEDLCCVYDKEGWVDVRFEPPLWLRLPSRILMAPSKSSACARLGSWNFDKIQQILSKTCVLLVPPTLSLIMCVSLILNHTNQRGTRTYLVLSKDWSEWLVLNLIIANKVFSYTCQCPSWIVSGQTSAGIEQVNNCRVVDAHNRRSILLCTRYR